MISELKNTENLPNRSNWFIGIGIVLIILGCFALSYQFVATVFSVYFIGALLFIAGIAQAFHSFYIKGFGETVLWAVLGVLYIIVGLLAFAQPVEVSSALTLVLSFLLMMSGITQTLAALSNRNYPRWGWLLTSGIITFILGLLIVLGWPGNSLWILGMFLGIDLIFQGWAYVTIGFALKNQ
ncbi:HdeD family acid-resistance protein [Orbaceae bacterium ESL0727]|nr:HdeD family acid-resistance protein [Orbaceae bacterium ESL0727]